MASILFSVMPDMALRSHRASNTAPRSHGALDKAPCPNTAPDTIPRSHAAPDVAPHSHGAPNTIPHFHGAPNMACAPTFSRSSLGLTPLENLYGIKDIQSKRSPWTGFSVS